MKHLAYLAFSLLFLLLLSFGIGCSVQNNTASTRFYHNFTTRYNVYYNGATAFDQSYTTLLQNYSESYTERLSMEPLQTKAVEEKTTSGGAFDGALEKGRKAIRMHSIRTKPKQPRGKRQANTAFYRKKEYNTFIYNAWILVGKSQYYNGDFLDAMATFSYMARLYRDEPNIRAIARLWQSRCYIALGWVPDAERTLATVSSEDTRKQKGLYAKALADVALTKDDPSEAIEPLKRAIKYEKDKLTRIRLCFLLGQIQQECGRNSEAKHSFKKVISAAPPFEAEVAARLNIIGIDAASNKQNALRQLKSMQHNGRYKTVVDRVSYTKGMLLLEARDTIKAIEAFSYGIEHSTEQKHAYALNAITLAEIYLAQNDFIAAQEMLSLGMGALDHNFERYDTLSTLSKQLDKLAIHFRSVREQDSLRSLASMPEQERFRIIDSAITAYKKQQRESKRTAQMEEQQSRSQSFNEQMGERNTGEILPPSGTISDNSFYFYNPQLIERGKTLFKKTWGSRALEDDWQRRNKQLVPGKGFSTLESSSQPVQGDDSTATEISNTPTGEEQDASQDPTKREYYLAQLPFSEEAITASDAIIQKDLSEAGAILNEEMELFEPAIHTYEDLLRRYPDYENRFQVYYTLYMICERINKAEEAMKWRNMMIKYYPNEVLTKKVASPDYLLSLKQQEDRENELYQHAYDAYFRGDASSVLTTLDSLISTYPLTELKPKALFLQGLAYALKGNANNFSEKLTALVSEYSKDETALIAQEMLAGLKAGRTLVPGGYSGLDYSSIFGTGDNEFAVDSLAFTHSFETDKYHALLIASPKIERNALLFAIATFNFAHYTDYIMDLKLEEHADYLLIDIAPMPDKTIMRSYMRKAYSPDGFMKELSDNAMLLPISEDNLQKIKAGLSLPHYINYLADTLITSLPEAAIPLEHYAEQRILKEEGNSNAVPTTDKLKDTVRELPDQLNEVHEEVKPIEPLPLPQDSITSRNKNLPLPADSVTISTGVVDSAIVDSAIMLTDSTTIAETPIKYEDVRKLRQERIKAERKAKRERQEALKRAKKEREEQLKARKKEREKKERLRKEQQRQREKERRAQQRSKQRKR